MAHYYDTWDGAIKLLVLLIFAYTLVVWVLERAVPWLARWCITTLLVPLYHRYRERRLVQRCTSILCLRRKDHLDGQP